MRNDQPIEWIARETERKCLGRDIGEALAGDADVEILGEPRRDNLCAFAKAPDLEQELDLEQHRRRDRHDILVDRAARRQPEPARAAFEERDRYVRVEHDHERGFRGRLRARYSVFGSAALYESPDHSAGDSCGSSGGPITTLRLIRRASRPGPSADASSRTSLSRTPFRTITSGSPVVAT